MKISQFNTHKLKKITYAALITATVTLALPEMISVSAATSPNSTSVAMSSSNKSEASETANSSSTSAQSSVAQSTSSTSTTREQTTASSASQSSVSSASSSSQQLPSSCIHFDVASGWHWGFHVKKSGAKKNRVVAHNVQRKQPATKHVAVKTVIYHQSQTNKAVSKAVATKQVTKTHSSTPKIKRQATQPAIKAGDHSAAVSNQVQPDSVFKPEQVASESVNLPSINHLAQPIIGQPVTPSATPAKLDAQPVKLKTTATTRSLILLPSQRQHPVDKKQQLLLTIFGGLIVTLASGLFLIYQQYRLHD